MPDFNLAKPEVFDWHLDNLRFWLNRGLDGLRLDAVPHLVERDAKDWNDQPESRVLTKRLQDQILAYPHRFVVCEATAKPADYADPRSAAAPSASGWSAPSWARWAGVPAPCRNWPTTSRPAAQRWPPCWPTTTSLPASASGTRCRATKPLPPGGRQPAAAARHPLPLLRRGNRPGRPAGNLPGDLPLRAPMSWTPDARTGGFTTGTPFRAVAPNVATHNVQMQRADRQSILHFYKAMIGLRNTLPSIARGSYEAAFAQGLVAGWQRRLEGEHSVVLINYGLTPATVTVQDLPARARLRSAWPQGVGPSRADPRGRLRITLPPQHLRVLVVQPAATAR
jgi:alpha-amylase